jgi:hypothetical protein
VSGHGSKQNRKLEEAAVAMLMQRNVEEAARSVGISIATLMRWQKLPEFQTAYREARRAAYGQAIARLQQGTSAAATTLLKTMIDPDTPASVGYALPKPSSITLPRPSRLKTLRHASRNWNAHRRWPEQAGASNSRRLKQE